MDCGRLLNDAKRNRVVFDVLTAIDPSLQVDATNHLGGHSVISVQRMLRRFRLITLLVVQRGLLLNEFDFSRAVR